MMELELGATPSQSLQKASFMCMLWCIVDVTIGFRNLFRLEEKLHGTLNLALSLDGQVWTV